jgi:hypothetical protein
MNISSKQSALSTPQINAVWRAWAVFGAVGVALLWYLMPWVIGRGAGMTFGAYDLAEWASLSPAAPPSTVPFMTGALPTLLLRLPLLLLAWLIALDAAGSPRLANGAGLAWWLKGAAVMVLAVAALPPLEFLRVDPNNANYGQQLRLAVLALVGGGGWMLLGRLLTPRWAVWAHATTWGARWGVALLAALCAASALWGMTLLPPLFALFNIAWQSGAGGILFALWMAAMATVWGGNRLPPTR